MNDYALKLKVICMSRYFEDNRRQFSLKENISLCLVTGNETT